MHEVRYHLVPTRLGELLVTDHGSGLSGLYYPEHRRGPRIGDAWVRDAERFSAVEVAIAAYLDGHDRPLDLPLDTRGTAFQIEVWEALRTVGYGRTVSYGELARMVGRPGSARAVASAVARNPVSIIVPCHRVIGADGTLTGYAGGIDRKRDLLTMERGATSSGSAAAPISG